MLTPVSQIPSVFCCQDYFSFCYSNSDASEADCIVWRPPLELITLINS